jgi:DNA-binding MarR family transcriptional regulator
VLLRRAKLSKERALQVAQDFIDATPFMMRAFSSAARQVDPPMHQTHFRTLKQLGTPGGPRTLTELAETQRISMPSASNTIEVMVTKGWVERVPDQNDRRQAALRVTDTGKAAVESANNQIRNLFVERLEGRSDDELARIQDAIAVLRHVFDGAPQ